MTVTAEQIRQGQEEAMKALTELRARGDATAEEVGKFGKALSDTQEHNERLEKALETQAAEVAQMRKDREGLSLRDEIAAQFRTDLPGVVEEFNLRHGRNCGGRPDLPEKFSVEEFCAIQQALRHLSRFSFLRVPPATAELRFAALKDAMSADQWPVLEAVMQKSKRLAFLFEEGNNANGGHLLEEAQARSIWTEASIQSDLMMHIHVMGVNTLNTEVLIPAYGGGANQWLGEGEKFTVQDTPTFANKQVKVHKNATLFEATIEALEDAIVNLEQFGLSYFSRKVGEAIEKAILQGTGDANHQPVGLIAGSTKTNTARAQTHVEDANWNRFYAAKSGVDSGFAGDAVAAEGGNPAVAADPVKTVDWLMNFMNMRRAYKRNAKWFCNRATWVKLCQLRDGDGRYLLQHDFREAMPDRLLGKPIITSDWWPDYNADGAFGLAFGDMSAAYTMLRRTEMRLVRDMWTKADEDKVRFSLRCRLGGTPLIGPAMHFMQSSA